MRSLLILLGMIVISASADPATWYVPDDFDTIQEAIVGVGSGETIVVRSGTYGENIDFLGKAIILVSESGAATTTIDGSSGNSCVVKFTGGEGPSTVLEGFTIKGGTGNNLGSNQRYGGGIYIYDSSPTIRDNVITLNTANQGGGGICCDWVSDATIMGNTITFNTSKHGPGIGVRDWSDPLITGNVIDDNSLVGVDGNGGGIWIYNGSAPTVKNNTINSNSAASGGGIYCMTSCSPLIESNSITHNNATVENGGGISCLNYSPAKIINNIIAHNWTNLRGGGVFTHTSKAVLTNSTIVYNESVAGGGGLYTLANSNSATLANCILWGNEGNGGLLQITASGYVDVSYCDVQGGWTGAGNINSPPSFLNPVSEDYHLDTDSPCIDVGTNSAPNLPNTDIDGQDRTIDGDGNGSEIVDMGADEVPDPTLVELVSFEAVGHGQAVLVAWETASEIDTAGFHIWRSWKRKPGEGDFIRITGSLIPAQGSPSCGAIYHYYDGFVIPGHAYCYRLEDVSVSGNSTFHVPAVTRWWKPGLGHR